MEAIVEPTEMRLRLSGRALIETPQGRRTLERKEAALFAVLAFDGATSRSRLAGLLWPMVSEVRARANLRQLLHRLGDVRRALVGSDPLELSPQLQIDGSGADEDRILLAHHDYSDSPDLQRWLDQARERELQAQLTQLEYALDQAEQEGDIAAARRHAERILALDPFSEVRVQRLVTLFLRWGDRSAAQHLFDRARGRLAAELDVDRDSVLPLIAELFTTETDSGLGPLLAEAESLVGRDREAALLRLDATAAFWQAGWLGASDSGEAILLAEAAEPLALYFEHRSRSDEGLALLMRAAVRLELHDDPVSRRALGRLLVHAAWLRHRLGLAASSAAARGVALLREAGDTRHLAQGLYALGAAHWYSGDRASARAAWTEAEAWIHRGASPSQMQHLHGNLAMAADALGDLERARHHYRAALELCHRSGDLANAIPYLNNLGLLLLRLDRCQDAEAELREGLRLARGTEGQEHMQPVLLDSLATAVLAVGRSDEAEALLSEAERLAARSPESRYLRVDLQLTRCRLLLATGQPAAANALAALTAAWKIDYRPAVENALLLLARALLLAEAPSGALPILAALANEAADPVRSEALGLLPDDAPEPPVAPLLARLVPSLLGLEH